MRRPFQTLLLLTLVTASLFTVTHHVQSAGLANRHTADQADDTFAEQVHVMYVLPSDGIDEQLDRNGTIATSVAAAQYWLRGQTAGRSMVLDTRSGVLDITFLRLNRTNAQMLAFGDQSRNEIENELIARGFINNVKAYLVYYGGGHNSVCGHSPPALNGLVSVLYLKGTPPGVPPCSANVLGGSPIVPGYWEFSALHVLMGTFGVVAACAPHHVSGGRVSDSPSDLMYAGPLSWTPATLDIGRDDYFNHNIGGCADLDTSPFLGPPVPSDLGAFTYFADSMEAGPGQIGPQAPWAVTTEAAHTGQRAWSDSPGGPYGPHINASLFLPVLNFSTATAPRLRFWQRRAIAEDGVDSANVWISVNNGGTYTQLASFVGSTGTDWVESTIDLSSYAGFSSVLITFQVFSNGSVFGDGWYVDDISIAEPSLVANGAFSAGMANWQVYAQPSTGNIVYGISNGVFQFYRVPDLLGQPTQAVVLQNTGLPLAAGAALEARFDLGNSSTARKRVSVLIHDANFSDLFVCTFWLPSQTPLSTYRMQTHSTQAWSNVSISFYSATEGHDGGFNQVDNVSIRYASDANVDRTLCVDPFAPSAVSPSPDTSNLLSNGDFEAGTISGWTAFGQLVYQVTNGTFEFLRPSVNPNPAGVLLQPTATSIPAGTAVFADFFLGNSSAVRKRVTVLLHDLDFSDLSACTFWLSPNEPLNYRWMTSYATRQWQNATISFYAATAGDEPWIVLDDVVFEEGIGFRTSGTSCADSPGLPGGTIAPMRGARANGASITR